MLLRLSRLDFVGASQGCLQEAFLHKHQYDIAYCASWYITDADCYDVYKAVPMLAKHTSQMLQLTSITCMFLYGIYTADAPVFRYKWTSFTLSGFYLFTFPLCHAITFSSIHLCSLSCVQIEALIMSANSNLTLEEIEDTFQFPLDGFQKQAVSHFLEGKSVLVCAPTGAGKTAIAEAAAVAVLARSALLYSL